MDALPPVCRAAARRLTEGRREGVGGESRGSPAGDTVGRDGHAYLTRSTGTAAKDCKEGRTSGDAENDTEREICDLASRQRCRVSSAGRIPTVSVIGEM